MSGWLVLFFSFLSYDWFKERGALADCLFDVLLSLIDRHLLIVLYNNYLLNIVNNRFVFFSLSLVALRF